VLGISTRKVDDLMAALGGCSVSRSEVSRICALLDEELAEFRDRPLDEPYPYVWFDATYERRCARAAGYRRLNLSRRVAPHRPKFVKEVVPIGAHQ
jgi:putative transposase